MTDELFGNAYAAGDYAAAYAALGFRGTYGLAYRDLPTLYREHVTGPAALDFGCGSGVMLPFLCGICVYLWYRFVIMQLDPLPEWILSAASGFVRSWGSLRRCHATPTPLGKLAMRGRRSLRRQSGS